MNTARNYLLSSFLTTLIILCGCASPARAPITPRETSVVFDKGFDSVWAALISEVASENPVAVSDKASGILQTQPLAVASGIGAGSVLQRVAIAPTVFLGTWSSGRVLITANVTRLDDTHTRLKFRCVFEGFENNVTKVWHRWASNGAYEEELIGKIKQALAP